MITCVGNEKEGIEDFQSLFLGILASFGKDSYINWPKLLVFWPLLVFPPCHYPGAPVMGVSVAPIRSSQRSLRRDLAESGLVPRGS